MFNPFKKKDDGFKLDETTLPNLNEAKSLENDNLSSSMPNLDSGEQMPNLTSTNDSLSNANDNSFSDSLSPQNAFSTPTMGSDVGFSTNVQTTDNSQNLNFDIIKTKIESMESRASLRDVKLENIEKKLDLILQLLNYEVSDETRKKFKLDTMMNKVKNS